MLIALAASCGQERVEATARRTDPPSPG
jgi:hypothetical protein